MKLPKLQPPQITFFVMLIMVLLTMGLSLGGGIYGKGILQKRSEKVIALKVQNETLEKQKAVYEQARSDVEKYKYYGQVADEVLPKDKDLAKVTKELVKIAGDLGIIIASITYPASTVGTAAPATPTTGTAPKTTPTVPAAPSITQTKPVEGLSGVLAVEVNVTPENSVTYEKLLSFLDNLSQNRRKLQVTRVGLSTDKNNLITFSLTLNLFIKP